MLTARDSQDTDNPGPGQYIDIKYGSSFAGNEPPTDKLAELSRVQEFGSQT